jgi:DNA-binding transcriptional regulator YhcF (GntR family)
VAAPPGRAPGFGHPGRTGAGADVIVEVDPDSPTPPYEQIRAQIATMIGAGTLARGAHLPPIRQLAADLGLAANTVARAYRELENAGLVVSRVRHGTTVSGTGRSLTRAEIRRRLVDGAAAYAALARQLGVDPDQAEAAAHRAIRGAGNPSTSGSDQDRPDPDIEAKTRPGAR